MVFVRDILKLADTSREAKIIIKSGEIFVDKKRRKDEKYSLGLMDSIEIPKLDNNYRIITDKHGLNYTKISSNESGLKLCKITDKTLIKGNLQLNLHDGKTLLIKVKNPKKPKEDIYKTGDTILLEMPKQKLKKHLKMEKNMLCLITGGQNKGEIVKINDIIIKKTGEPTRVVCSKKDKEFVTIKDYVFVIGKTNPVIKLD